MLIIDYKKEQYNVIIIICICNGNGMEWKMDEMI